MYSECLEKIQRSLRNLLRRCFRNRNVLQFLPNHFPESVQQLFLFPMPADHPAECGHPLSGRRPGQDFPRPTLHRVAQVKDGAESPLLSHPSYCPASGPRSAHNPWHSASRHPGEPAGTGRRWGRSGASSARLRRRGRGWASPWRPFHSLR